MDLSLTPDSERQALESFRRRLNHIQQEVRAIDQALARRDLLSLAHRAREASRLTRELLEKNIEILFEGHPASFHQDLFDHLNYAETHVTRALSEEVEFQAIEQRLYLAARLAEDVLSHVAGAGAVSEMERPLDQR